MLFPANILVAIIDHADKVLSTSVFTKAYVVFHWPQVSKNLVREEVRLVLRDEIG